MSHMKYVIAVMFAIVLTAFMPWQKKQKVIFFGDSITQAGVDSGGYIVKLGELLKSKKQDSRFELIGAGIGGNKIYDLYLRMDSDVVAKKPDIVVIWVGVNDVWHKSMYGTGTDPDKFEKFYERLIQKLQAEKIKVILTTPAAIGEKTDFSNSQDGDLNQYAKIIRGLASRKNCGLVDLRKKFLEYDLAHNPENKESGILTADRVHLNEKGNALVAEEMLKILSP